MFELDVHTIKMSLLQIFVAFILFVAGILGLLQHLERDRTTLP